MFDTDPGVDPRPGLEALREQPADGGVAIGIGAPLALAARAKIDGLRGFPALSGVGVAFPSMQGALWVFVRGEERSIVLDRSMAMGRELRGVGIARGGDGMVGGSFVAVQRYVHDLARFEGLDAAKRDAIIGRRADTNEEIRMPSRPHT